MWDKNCHNAALIISLLLVVGLGACREDGENPYVLWEQFSHPDLAFSFYYMKPPFKRVNLDDTHPILLLDPFETPTIGGLDARIHIEAWVCEQYFEAELNDRYDYWRSKAYVKERYIGYFNYFGDKGAMLEMERQDHWVKEIFYPYGDECVAISAATNDKGSRPDIEFLLAGFRPGQVED
ncbi:MAG: hypothetical protein JXX14_08145 [Deltaproteobacteria bacterium]|nr:hypothetical protein [Deltaproteobacteria bacterium]